MSTENITESVDMETLLEKNNREELGQKIEDDRYQVRFREEGIEVVDTEEEYASLHYNSLDELEQDLKIYDAEASGRYGMFETEGDTKVLYDRRAGDNLIESDNTVDLENMT